MFDPKMNNLLDQELAVSGLEMNIIGAIATGISAVAGIAGAASGASAQQDAAAAQNEMFKKQAKLTNKYNKKKFKADKKHFEEMRQYNYDTAITNWKYQQDIQDYEYNAQIRAYNRDQQNLANTLKVNDIAARQGYIQEQRVMRELEAEQTFNRTDAYIANLQTQGRARLGSAGQSVDRAIQMTAADHGRNLAIMDASFTSSLAQHNMNMFDIALNHFGANMVAKANAMLKPERLPDLPEPSWLPEPEWIEPVKAEAQTVSAPSGGGAILGSIGNAIGSFSGIAGGMGAAAGGTPTPVGGL